MVIGFLGVTVFVFLNIRFVWPSKHRHRFLLVVIAFVVVAVFVFVNIRFVAVLSGIQLASSSPLYSGFIARRMRPK